MTSGPHRGATSRGKALTDVRGAGRAEVGGSGIQVRVAETRKTLNPKVQYNACVRVAGREVGQGKRPGGAAARRPGTRGEDEDGQDSHGDLLAQPGLRPREVLTNFRANHGPGGGSSSSSPDSQRRGKPESPLFFCEALDPAVPQGVRGGAHCTLREELESGTQPSVIRRAPNSISIRLRVTQVTPVVTPPGWRRRRRTHKKSS